MAVGGLLTRRWGNRGFFQTPGPYEKALHELHHIISRNNRRRVWQPGFTIR